MRIYRSKVDTWLAVVLVGSCMLPLMGFVASLLNGRPMWPDLIVTLGLFVVFSGLIAWLYLATKYKVSDTEVIIDGGLFSVTIPLHSIQSIAKSNNPLSSPAFSLDRLEITYENTKKILISPKYRDEFLSDIGWDKSDLIKV